jgi:hypothetical protein
MTDNVVQMPSAAAEESKLAQSPPESLKCSFCGASSGGERKCRVLCGDGKLAICDNCVLGAINMFVDAACTDKKACNEVREAYLKEQAKKEGNNEG